MPCVAKQLEYILDTQILCDDISGITSVYKLVNRKAPVCDLGVPGRSYTFYMSAQTLIHLWMDLNSGDKKSVSEMLFYKNVEKLVVFHKIILSFSEDLRLLTGVAKTTGSI